MPSDGDEIWELSGPLGAQQRWTRENGLFTRAEIGGKTVNANEKDPDYDELCVHPPCEGCKQALPFAFKFCPDCGRPLKKAGLPRDHVSWHPPFGAPEGVPTVSVPIAPERSPREELTPPSAGAFAFFVGGTPRRLYAADQISGRVHVWSETADAWRELPCRAPSWSNIPRWSWSGVAGGRELVFPTNSGPVAISTSHTEARTATLPADWGDEDSCLGGAATLGQGLSALPVSRGGRMELAIRSESGLDWSNAAVVDIPVGIAEIFAAPVCGGGEAFWVGRGGYLFAENRNGTVNATYCLWPEDFEPILGLRPLYGPNGLYYQTGRRGEKAAGMTTLLPPGTKPELSEQRGYYISSGKAVFRENRSYRIPESEQKTEYVLEDGEFAVPLLAFGETEFLIAATTNRGKLLEFFSTDEAVAPRKCSLRYSPRSRILQPPCVVITVRHPWDILPFVYNEYLHIYNVQENKCFRWRLATG